MKISINSTFSYIKFNLNYGSALQCFALQKYLINRGHEPEHVRDYRANPKYIIIRLKNIRHARLFLKKITAMIRMQGFISKNLHLSKRRYFSYASLLKHCPETNCHIAGSDQIWHNSNNFRYLTYVPDNKLKLSYAASFGSATISENMKEIIRPYLQRLDGISVREESGVEIINSMGLDSEWHLDPTLLIESEEYPYVSSRKKNYYYCYFLNLDSSDDIPYNTINKIAFFNKKELFLTAPLNYMLFDKKNQLFPSVEEWIGLYKDAECIFTNTYHGLLFSIIFKKQFIFFQQNGGQKNENERFYSLLKLLKLEDRIAKQNDENTIFKLTNEKIDYGPVYEIISEERKKTDSFFEKYGI